ncbi:MAG: energy-coupling factor transporter transmembrane component T family protein [Candidatus Rifleibacteriota bacterium]
MMINYIPGNSWLYRLNPLIKGFITLLLIISFSLFLNTPLALGLLFTSMVFFTKLAGVPLMPVTVSLRKIFLLLLIVGLIQGFSGPQFSWLLALTAVLRIVGVFFAAGIFITVSSQSELMFFWEQTFRPFNLVGLPARELALVMVIAVRFLPVILGEIDRIKMAQMARGAKLSGGFGLSAIKSLLPLMIPTLTLAIVRAGELAQAMEARGYCISGERTRLHKFSLSFADFFAFFLALTALFAIIFSEKLYTII